MKAGILLKCSMHIGRLTEHLDRKFVKIVKNCMIDNFRARSEMETKLASNMLA